MSPTRFPSGVTNVTSIAPLGNYGLPDPASWHTYHNDFDSYVAANWTVTAVGAGAVTLADVDGGAILITNAAADDNSVFLDKLGASFLMEAGKPALFDARFKISDATQSDFVMGLQIIDTTPLAVSDGIWFQKDDGDTHIDVYCGKSAGAGTTSAIDIAEMADNTYLRLSWYFDGKQTVTYFVNGVAKGSLVASATYLPDAQLTVSFGIQNGEAVAKTMTVDYITAAKQR